MALNTVRNTQARRVATGTLKEFVKVVDLDLSKFQVVKDAVVFSGVIIKPLKMDAVVMNNDSGSYEKTGEKTTLKESGEVKLLIADEEACNAFAEGRSILNGEEEVRAYERTIDGRKYLNFRLQRVEEQSSKGLKSLF